jgi:hypothetical protein
MAYPTSNTVDSNKEMSRGDVESIGAHCQMEYCHVLDFLPFECNSCQGQVHSRVFKTHMC